MNIKGLYDTDKPPPVCLNGLRAVLGLVIGSLHRDPIIAIPVTFERSGEQKVFVSRFSIRKHSEWQP